MHIGLPTTVPAGDNDDYLKVFKLDDLGDGIGCRLTIKAVEGYGNLYYALVCDGIPQRTIYLPEDETRQVTLTYDPNLTNHAVSVVPIGEWDEIPPGCDVLIQQNYFENDKGYWSEITFDATYTVQSNSSQFSNWHLTGIQRFKNVKPVSYFKTRGRLDITLSSADAVHMLTLSLGDFVIATGSITGDGVITLTESNSSGVNGSVTLNYSSDLAIGAAFAEVAYAKAYKIYVNGTYNNTLNDYGLSNAYTTRIGPLSAGVHSITLKPVSDSDIEGNAATSTAVTINGRPEAVTNQQVISGNYLNTLISWTGSSTVGATYNLYDSRINDSTNLREVIDTKGNSLGTVYAMLPALAGIEQGIRRVIVESSLAGIESGYRKEIAIEYDSNGDVVLARPNIPGFQFNRIESGNKLFVDYYYNRVEEQATGVQAQLFMVASGSSINFSNPMAVRSMPVTTGVDIVTGTLSGIAGSSGYYNFCVRTARATGLQSQNTQQLGPFYLSTAQMNATSGASIIVVT